MYISESMIVFQQSDPETNGFHQINVSLFNHDYVHLRCTEWSSNVLILLYFKTHVIHVIKPDGHCNTDYTGIKWSKYIFITDVANNDSMMSF